MIENFFFDLVVVGVVVVGGGVGTTTDSCFFSVTIGDLEWVGEDFECGLVMG